VIVLPAEYFSGLAALQQARGAIEALAMCGSQSPGKQRHGYQQNTCDNPGCHINPRNDSLRRARWTMRCGSDGLGSIFSRSQRI